MEHRPNLVVVLCLLSAVGTTYYFFGLFLPVTRAGVVALHRGGGYDYGGDFYPIWMTTRELLLHRRDPYAAASTRQIQIGLYGRALDSRISTDPSVNYRAFSYPLYTDVLVAPLLPPSFDSVRIVLSAVLPFLVAMSILLWLTALDIHPERYMLVVALLLTFVSYPVLEGLWAQQPSLFSGALLAATMGALANEKLTMAGNLLALASIKPQMEFFFVIWIFLWVLSDWAHRKHLAIGFAAILGSLLMGSELVLPGWFRSWLSALVEYRHYAPPPLTQLVLGRILGYIAAICMIGIAGWAAWRSRHERSESSTFSLFSVFVLAITVVILPSSVAVYDQILLLPGVLWVCSRIRMILNESRALRGLAVLSAVLLIWPWAAACAVSLCSFIFPAWVRTSWILLLPLRVAASIPFALVALLGWLMVGHIRRGTARVDRVRALASP